MTAIEGSSLFLFTETYPYDAAGEDPFLDPEIPHLLHHFEKIMIFPRRTMGKRHQLPKEITVNTDLAKIFSTYHHLVEFGISFCYAAGSRFFYQEILKKPALLFQFINFYRLITYSGEAIRTKRWLLQFIAREQIDLNKAVFYTYWCKETTLGIGYIKSARPELMLISRAHGEDIYNERYDPPYIPCRPEIFQSLDTVFIASADGQHYLSSRYPLYEQKFEVAKLGINDTGFISKPSGDGIVRIVSCSFLVPVKRIELLIRGLRELGILQKNRHFSWTHIGNGPLQPGLESLADSLLPENVRHTFVGFIPNAEVISFYKSNPVDIFINVSKSEGGNPVSIMEAQCCGIPVIATAVGGNKEIVTSDTGVLLSPSPEPREIADATIALITRPDDLFRKKNDSKKNWEEHYNADKNFEDFVRRILALRARNLE